MTDQLEIMLLLSGFVFVLGVLALIAIWVRNIRVMRGADLPITENDIAIQRVARASLLFGTVGALGVGLTYASHIMSFGAFLAFVGAFCAIGLAVCFRIDAVRARRHR